MGDTDPPKSNVLRPFSRKNSRTSRIESQREFSEAPAPLTGRLGQKKTPTSAATEAGANTQTKTRKPGTYQGGLARAIISFRVGPDLLVQSFAFAEVLA